MTWRRRLSLLLCALALGATGCASDEPSTSSLRFTAQSPIEELLGVPVDPAEAAAWDDAFRHLAIGDCMSAAGLDYQVDANLLRLASPTITVNGQLDETVPELVTFTSARTMLAAMRSSVEATATSGYNDPRIFDPNFDADRSFEEQNEFYAALSGSSEGPGCLQQSTAAPAADTTRNGGLIAQFNAAVDAALASDQSVLAEAANWRTCMATEGHEYDSPGAAERTLRKQAGATGQLSLDELTQDTADVQTRMVLDLEPIAELEAQVATASARCAANWLDERKRVRQAVADDFVERFG